MGLGLGRRRRTSHPQSLTDKTACAAGAHFVGSDIGLRRRRYVAGARKYRPLPRISSRRKAPSTHPEVGASRAGGFVSAFRHGTLVAAHCRAYLARKAPTQAMSTEFESPTGVVLAEAAREAGLATSATATGADFHGRPTVRLAFAGAAQQPLYLEVSDGYVPGDTNARAELVQHLKETALRLQNPQPEVYVTANGLPLQFTGFQWPFHRSTSGADTLIVHGNVQLADGTGSPLHSKISASVTVTFAEIMTAPEQPFAEDFIYNAIRKTYDYGQLELLKSGNRQPVPVTTRYYSRWQNKFVFADSTEQSRSEFLALKAFWLSGILGAGAPVWLADPRDAQYLNTTPAEMQKAVQQLAQEGVLSLTSEPGFAAAAPALRNREQYYRDKLQEALDFIKPTFNEEMRAGHTNM